MEIKIRHGEMKDLDRIMEIYAIARRFMAEHDNPNQWKNNRPPRETVERDIRMHNNYVLEGDGQVEAVFFFSTEKDPTYAYIEGKWKTEGEAYGVIHRIASSGKIKGVLERAVEFSLKFTDRLRMDTHKDNYVMQNALKKCGFEHCGTIYLENGEPREAYERA